jgi:hypothetical protein
LGLKGDIDEAKLELAEAIRLKPEYNTLKRYVAGTPWVTDPKGWALREKTLHAGLRNAGRKAAWAIYRDRLKLEAR